LQKQEKINKKIIIKPKGERKMTDEKNEKKTDEKKTKSVAKAIGIDLGTTFSAVAIMDLI